LNRAVWQLSEFPYKSTERGCLTSSIVDIESIPEIIAPLLGGIPLITFNHHIINNTANFLQKLTDTKVTRMSASPALLNKVITFIENMDESSRENMVPCLEYWIVVGDILTKDLGERFFRIFQSPHQRTLVHYYGTTEVMSEACFETFETIEDLQEKSDAHKSTVSLGTPLANSKVYIFDEDMKLAPLGNVGEICVYGAPLCLGYVTGSRANSGAYSGNFCRNPLSKSKGKGKGKK